MNDRQYMRISELLLYCCSGSAGREDMAELEALLDRNPQALEYCVDILMDLNYFHCLGQTPVSQPEPAKNAETDFMSELDPQQQLALLGDFAEYEKHAAAMEIVRPRESEVPKPAPPTEYKSPVRKIDKFSLAAAILCAAALFLMIVYPHFAPPAPYEAATITDSVNAEWSSYLPISPGTRMVSDSVPIRLTKGIIKLRTDDLVEVVVEAPAEFCFTSYSEVSMNYGRLFAHVSEQGYGFSVVTPNSKIVDLGTEFGVVGHVDGNTEVHLYKGRANLFAGEKHQRKSSLLLTAGSARRVDSGSSNIEEIALDERALVRDIDSKAKFVWRGQKAVRLTDLILGGNGFGTAARQQVEFDPDTGLAVTEPVAGYRRGPGQFVPIPGNPYLDGIFVPGEEEGEMTVTSAGHRFRECPKTSGLYYSNIICYKNWSFFNPLQQTFEQTRKQFSDSGALYLHSNIGLTMDLNAVRRAVPGLRVDSFTAFAGIIRMGDNAPEYSDADIWILVDGQLKASRKGLRADQGYDVCIDIADQDQFLTLIVTDGGKAYVEGQPANHLDTCGFAEPVFHLVSP